MINDVKYKVQAGFFDAIEEDRTYSAEDMNRPYTKIISNGVFATPQGKPSDYLQVFSAENGMNVIVSAGYGFIGDKWFENPSNLMITISQNSEILTRIDSIIAQVDKTQAGREGSIVYRQGTASSNPIHPEINKEENIYEYRLADIEISPSCVEITQDLIKDCRGSEECPWITSLIYQVDTSTLYAQWQEAYKKYYEDQKEEQKNFFNDFKTRIESFFTDEEEEFMQWFENIKGQLSGDIAATLQSEMQTLQSNINIIDGKVDSLETNMDSAQTNINTMQKTVDTLETDVKDNMSKSKTITIQVSEWQEYQDNNKTKYKYEVIDETVTENHLVLCFPNEDEQEKITGSGSTKTENGKYTIILTEKPTEAITMDIVISKTTKEESI